MYKIPLYSLICERYKKDIKESFIDVNDGAVIKCIKDIVFYIDDTYCSVRKQNKFIKYKNEVVLKKIKEFLL